MRKQQKINYNEQRSRYQNIYESEKLGDIHDICLAIEVAIMSQ